MTEASLSGFWRQTTTAAHYRWVQGALMLRQYNSYFICLIYLLGQSIGRCRRFTQHQEALVCDAAQGDQRLQREVDRISGEGVKQGWQILYINGQPGKVLYPHSICKPSWLAPHNYFTIHLVRQTPLHGTWFEYQWIMACDDWSLSQANCYSLTYEGSCTVIIKSASLWRA